MDDKSYVKFFDPAGGEMALVPDHLERVGDRTRKPVYVYNDKDCKEDKDEHKTDDIVLSVNIALATGRPLLVSGRPGTGKTSLAAHVAHILRWRFYTFSISHRTQARDLQWSFDMVRRLADAQAGELKHPVAYISPGVLWWAFDRESALNRGQTPDRLASLGIPSAQEQNQGQQADQAVVLLDEIDKAEPDVPNNLLESIGSYRFAVEDLQFGEEPGNQSGTVILPQGAREVRARRAPLIILTTNDERELPRAFVRRCISLTLKLPKRERLLDIGRAHFPGIEEALVKRVADELEAICEESEPGQALPASAEFIDTLAACRELGLSPTEPEKWQRYWNRIVEATLKKRRELDSSDAG